MQYSLFSAFSSSFPSLQHLVSSPPSPVETAVRVMVECAGGDHTQDEDIIYSAFELLGDEDPGEWVWMGEELNVKEGEE